MSQTGLSHNVDIIWIKPLLLINLPMLHYFIKLSVNVSNSYHSRMTRFKTDTSLFIYLLKKNVLNTDT